ncbi:SH3 domain-containing protein [Phyllobacterium sp. BT25]|uniref:SH3 domain-containing protein n=1 Tax=Phyllobacterium pellucidum TaxID=2740464 RepID=A0A849VKE9_9HYPH|nr:SH3 domain-containing protein [Phyllobacterium pellucidum]NTS29756.1 SH3 domain-containing protein [Phyllobacterium pellucidum]
MKWVRVGGHLQTMLLALGVVGAGTSVATALTFKSGELTNGIKYIAVQGEFEFDENLAPFAQLVKQTDPIFVSFNSPGGNPVKAMELGRLIRILNLATYQPRGSVECASACALAFLGGVVRMAEPGAIGVHKSSFSGSANLNLDAAVSQIQHVTAETISYMTEMGVDPALLELSLKYEKDDIRYLSKSEMTAYRVTTPMPSGDQNVASDQNIAPPAPTQLPAPRTTAALPDSSIPAIDARFEIPLARTGKVRHPEGSEFLRASTDQASQKLGMVKNGDPVSILNVYDRWYYVNVRGQTGYLHHNWVKVDQFVSMPFNNRYIQIASFDNYLETQAYMAKSSMRLTAYYATNHWFAVTLSGTYPAKRAAEALKVMKSNGSIPDDAFMTVGNTYVGKACCE